MVPRGLSAGFFLRRLTWGVGMLACVASIFALMRWFLGGEDASGNGFEVFVYYEMGSVFALWKC